MKKLQITRNPPTRDELLELYKKERNTKLKERYHALYLMHEFKNCTDVAKILGKNRSSVQNWVNFFNEGGVDALIPRTPPGRPTYLSGAQMDQLKGDVLTNPRELGYDFSNWEGKSVAHHIRKKFRVMMSVRAAQELLHKLGFTLQRPKYKFLKADAVKQKEFVENFKKKWILLEKIA